MREINFRGRGKDGNWLYGYLFKDEDACFIKLPYRKHRYGSGIEVSPETVGQFTGVYDKNGCEIYEGDIVKKLDTPLTMAEKEHFVWQVVYKNASFWLLQGNEYKEIDISEYHVVGNIHDNPELNF